MKKTGDTLRKWLEETIAKRGGPVNCPDDFQLHEHMLALVSVQAAYDFQTVVMADSGVTVKEYLQKLEKYCSES